MCRDINQAHHFRVIANIGDNRTAVTVSYKNSWTILHRDHPFHRRHVVAEGGQRVLRHRHVVAMLYENFIYGLPPRPVDPCSMNQHDVFYRLGDSRHRDGHQEKGASCGGEAKKVEHHGDSLGGVLAKRAADHLVTAMLLTTLVTPRVCCARSSAVLFIRPVLT